MTINLSMYISEWLVNQQRSKTALNASKHNTECDPSILPLSPDRFKPNHNFTFQLIMYSIPTHPYSSLSMLHLHDKFKPVHVSHPSTQVNTNPSSSFPPQPHPPSPPPPQHPSQ